MVFPLCFTSKKYTQVNICNYIQLNIHLYSDLYLHLKCYFIIIIRWVGELFGKIRFRKSWGWIKRSWIVERWKWSCIKTLGINKGANSVPDRYSSVIHVCYHTLFFKSILPVYMTHNFIFVVKGMMYYRQALNNLLEQGKEKTCICITRYIHFFKRYTWNLVHYYLFVWATMTN